MEELAQLFELSTCASLILTMMRMGRECRFVYYLGCDCEVIATRGQLPLSSCYQCLDNYNGTYLCRYTAKLCDTTSVHTSIPFTVSMVPCESQRGLTSLTTPNHVWTLPVTVKSSSLWGCQSLRIVSIARKQALQLMEAY